MKILIYRCRRCLAEVRNPESSEVCASGPHYSERGVQCKCDQHSASFSFKVYMRTEEE